jgi:hypothetical protein
MIARAKRCEWGLRATLTETPKALYDIVTFELRRSDDSEF